VEEVETVIFVDVDGVLNVGARDHQGPSPILLNDLNLRCSKRLWSQRQGRPDRACVETVVSISQRCLDHGEQGTYSKLACEAPSHLSKVLVQRLAALLRTAGWPIAMGQGRPGAVAAVLSSSWRRPKQIARVRGLERALSQQLGCPFTFTGRTEFVEDDHPEARLTNVANFVAELCLDIQLPLPHHAVAPRRKLRVLMLDDFFITPMGEWSCGGLQIDSAAAAESYILGQAGKAMSGLPSGTQLDLEVKVVHAYDEWTTEDGLPVQLGSGLTMLRFCEAMTFLGGECWHCSGADPSSAAPSCDGQQVIVDPPKVSKPKDCDNLHGPEPTSAAKHPMTIRRLPMWRCLAALWPWLLATLPWNPWTLHHANLVAEGTASTTMGDPLK